MVTAVSDFVRIATDFRYFLSLCKINDAHKGVISFEFWPHLLELITVFLTQSKIIVLKSRQVGVSYILALYALWKAMTCKGFNCLIISAGEKPAARLLEKAKFAYMHLPEWIRQNVPYGKWSETEITFPTIGSRIVALPSTESPAVGETASLVIMDEHDFHAYPESDFAAAEPTASAGGQIICVSTSDKTKPDSLFKVLCKQAMEKVSSFYFHFIPWDARPGRDEGWLEEEAKSYIGREDELDENYPSTPEQALSPLSAKAFFNTDILTKWLDEVKEPLETRFGCTHIYSKFQPSWAYAGGADISQGVGGDYQALVLLGKKGNSVEDVAYIHANDIQYSTYAHYTNELGLEYNYPLLGGESNSMGLSYLQALQELNYRRLYFRKENVLGWWTDGDHRERSLIELSQAINDGLLTIRFKPLITQMIDFQRMQGRSGKIEYKSVGKHDDLVIACAIAYQMIKQVRPNVKTQFKSLLVERHT